MAASVTVRMYNQLNPGDCFLLRFVNGKDESFVLIDFGSYGKSNEERELEIADNIYKTVGDKPLIVVLTQQYKDHLSGFISGAPVLKKLNIIECWFSYSDDTNMKEAIAMRGITEILWKKNRRLKEKVRTKFGGVNAVDKMLGAQDAIDESSDDQISGAAIKNLVGWSKQAPKHLSPGESFDLPGIGKNSVRVYVLGSPEGQSLMTNMKNLESSSSLMFDALNLDADGINQAESKDFPFNKKFIRPVPGESETPYVIELYYNKDEWRRIDHVWLNEMGRISLRMDDLKRNSGLVLAFELAEQQKVLLFDTQANIANWENWTDFTTGNNNGKAVGNKAERKVGELLNRVVLYKPGRYPGDDSKKGKSAGLLSDDELAIMIPVNEEVSNKINFGMVSQQMLKDYNRISRGRVLRSDTIYQITKNDHSFKYPFASTEYDFPSAVNVAYDRANENHLYVEYTIQ